MPTPPSPAGTDQAAALAPLAHLGGARPASPAWFDAAHAAEPERRSVEVDGARLETLAWGRPGAPGLLFLHGNGAHAHWWSFIAPFFAEDWRVAAFSFSGMGGSDWRDSYTIDGAVAEAWGVAEALGLEEAPVKPVLVGHSFGGMIATAAAGRIGDRLRAAVVVDPPFATPERSAKWAAERAAAPARTEPHKVYPTLEAALARFRFLPPQSAEHLYIVDHIARQSLKPVEGGWTWRFDPQLMAKMTFSDLTADLASPMCPLALMHGDRSRMGRPEDLQHVWSTVPAGTPKIMIPDSQHHVMVDQPLALVAALRALLAAWPATAPNF